MSFWNSWTGAASSFRRRSGRQSLGIRTPHLRPCRDRTSQEAFLKLEEIQDSTSLGLFAVRAVRVGEHPVYVLGGRRLDKNFLLALDLPPDMRTLLYQNRGDHFSPDLLLDAGVGGNRCNVHSSCREVCAVDRSGPPVQAGNNRNCELVFGSGGRKKFFTPFLCAGRAKDRPLLGILADWKFSPVLRRTEAPHSRFSPAGG